MSMGYNEADTAQIINAHFEWAVHTGHIPQDMIHTYTSMSSCTLSEMERRRTVHLMNSMSRKIGDEYGMVNRNGRNWILVPHEGPSTTFGPKYQEIMPRRADDGR